MFDFFDWGSDGNTGDLPPAHGGGQAGLGTLLKLVSFLLVLGSIAFLIAGWNQQPSAAADMCFGLGKWIGAASVGIFLLGRIADHYF